jgi:hypothetical protein
MIPQLDVNVVWLESDDKCNLLSRLNAEGYERLRSWTSAYIWVSTQLLRRDGRNGEMLWHTSTVVAVPSHADTQLWPMGVAWSTTALIACSLRIRPQDFPPSHGPIALRCPGNGRFRPMSTPLISLSFPNY